MSQTDHVWALILAAGEGSRLRDLTSDAGGAAVPKHYCTLQGGPTLLQTTVRRAQGFASLLNTAVVVAGHHRSWWQRDLQALPPDNIVVQPRNCGTGNGILLQLLHVHRHDPDALVVLLPADQFVADEAVLARAIRVAVAEVRRAPESLLLLGIQPGAADPHLGYIVPAAASEGAALAVSEFIEKPPAPLARQLIARGALWNAFIVVASAATLLRLYQQHMPGVVGAMQRALADRVDPSRALAALYECLPTVDFSRDLLADSAALPLRVLPVPQCGWSDLGTPECVARVLARLPGKSPQGVRADEADAPVNLSANFQGVVRAHWSRPRADLRA